MAAPNYALRTLVSVNKIGTDDAGYNAVGAPMSHLTIASALADLAANYPAATLAAPHIVSVGPGTFAVAAGFALPPNTYIIGSCDAQGRPNTVLELADGAADITLATAWSANTAARGGIGNVTIRAASGTPIIDFTMPVPVAGNPARTLEMFTVQQDLTQLAWEATSTADVFRLTDHIHDGTNADAIDLHNGTIILDNVQHVAVLTIGDAGAATAAQLNAVLGDETSGLRAIAFAFPVDVRIVASRVPALTLDETAPGVVAVAADAVSIPVRASITYVGTAVSADLTRLSDANGEAYSPTTPADWVVVPVTVQEGLDYLAGGGVAASANGSLADTNNAGNTTITPTAHNWVQYETVTGAAGTRILILDVASPPLLGDIIKIFLTRTDGLGLIVEMRNAAAGGTLLDTLPDNTGGDTGFFEFTYGTIAGGYAADAWVRVFSVIPAGA